MCRRVFCDGFSHHREFFVESRTSKTYTELVMKLVEQSAYNADSAKAMLDKQGRPAAGADR